MSEETDRGDLRGRGKQAQITRVAVHTHTHECSLKNVTVFACNRADDIVRHGRRSGGLKW